MGKQVKITLLPENISLGDPWTPFVSDIWCYNGFLQEDVATGAVASWPNRGVRFASGGAAVQANGASQPTKLSGSGGVQFGAGDNLAWPSDSFRWVGVRTTLTIFRVDWSTVGGSIHIVRPQTLGGTTNAEDSSALLATSPGQFVTARWRDPRGGNEFNIYGLGETYSEWIMVLHYHRDGKLFCKVNGGDAEWHGFDTFQPDRLGDGQTLPSYLGYSGNGAGTFSIDCRLEFNGELSDDWMAKLERWGADRAGLTLPEGHPYADSAPVVGPEDFPLKVDTFNRPQWMIDITNAVPDITHRGEALPTIVTDAFDTLVFMDDFREKSVSPGNRTDQTIWYSVGGIAGNTIGDQAPLVYDNQSPDCYPWVPGEQGVRANIAANGTKRTGNICTVDRLDNGISFKGDMWLRYRFKMAFQGPIRAYYFPGCPWFYAHYRSKFGFSVAREIDTIEIDTAGTDYMNGMSHHGHESIMRPGLNGRPTTDLPNRKFVGQTMTVANGWPADIDFGDGEWHTFDWLIDSGTGTVYTAVDDGEMVRFPRPYVNDVRLHMLINNCIRQAGTYYNNEYCDIVMGEIEVRKKAADVAHVPEPFTGRPTISGTTYVGGLLTLDTNLPEGMQARIEWYHDDGYPIAREKGPVLALTTAEAGKRIRAKVLPIGHYEDDEAFSDLSAEIGAGADVLTDDADLNFATGEYTVNGVTYESWADLTTAHPQFAYQCDSVTDILSTDLVQTDVARHMPRIIPGLGLLYEGNSNYTRYNAKAPGGGLNGTWTPLSDDGPGIGGKVSAFYESSTSAIRRLAAIDCGQNIVGRRSSIVFPIKAAHRNIILVEGYYSGQRRAWFNLTTGEVSTETGITASMEPITGYEDWWLIYWSFADPAATSNATISIWRAMSMTDTGTAYTGDPVTAFYMGSVYALSDTERLKLPFPHLRLGTQRTGRLYLPLGTTPSTLTLTLTDPEDGTSADTQLFDAEGDYVPDAAALPQPVISRIQIVQGG